MPQPEGFAVPATDADTGETVSRRGDGSFGSSFGDLFQSGVDGLASLFGGGSSGGGGIMPGMGMGMPSISSSSSAAGRSSGNNGSNVWRQGDIFFGGASPSSGLLGLSSQQLVTLAILGVGAWLLTR
jgi:hypothetical protein